MLRQAEPAGNGERIGFSGNADQQPVGRLERLHVKLAGGVDHAVGTHGVNFQLRVMRRRGDLSAALAAEFDQRDGQRRALRRVGACAKLVQQHQRLAVADAHDLDDILHMRRESG